jgi:pimeloyl-ACP methyl ester carboxylesterase
MFDGIAPEIAALGFHAVAIDQRGHGDSTRVASAQWDAFTLDLALLIQRIGRRATLVGHSFGGGQVLSVASTFPDLVTKLVNIDGLGPPPELLRDDPSTLATWLATAESVWRQPQREYASLEEMAARRKEMNPRLPDEWLLHLARHGSAPGPRGGLVWKSDPHLRIRSPGPFGEQVLRAQYAGIRCAALVLTGAEPDVFAGRADEVLSARLEAIGEAEHHAVARAGHFVHLEQPQAVMLHLGRFLGA